MKKKKPTIKQGASYMFTKSGNIVKAVSRSLRYLGEEMWVVERVSGASAGKNMLVPACALQSAKIAA